MGIKGIHVRVIRGMLLGTIKKTQKFSQPSYRAVYRNPIGSVFIGFFEKSMASVLAVFVCHGSFEDQVHLVVAHLVLRTATGEVEIEHLRRALNFFGSG
jgi:hypothetical protein